MKSRKKKSENKVKINNVNKNGKKVNIWDGIKENFATINSTSKILKKSLQNLSMNTNLINEKLKSHAITSKRLINHTVAKLNRAKNDLRIAKINNASLKRITHADIDNSRKNELLN